MKILVILFGEKGIVVFYKIGFVIIFWCLSLQTARADGLYVFISFSMPTALLRQYVQEAKQYNAILVLRGLIDNDFRKTTTVLRQLDEQAGAIIEPQLFQQYDIQAVPAIVQDKAGIVRKISGSVSLQYALQQFAEAQ